MTMQPWFNQAKLGIFIHWGIYSVNGVPESWSIFNGEIPHDQYFAQLDGFTASRFDADAWAKQISRAGAGYAVLTAKHHDGVALWDTKVSDLSVVNRTPARRDLVAEYVAAMRQHGIRAGLYFSHSDWSHPDYASIRHTDPTRPWIDNRYAMPAPGQENPAAWQRYLAFRRAQIDELVTGFQPDLLWFDGQWERSEQQWQMKELANQINSLAPETVLNGRLTGHGDYITPEQGVPIKAPQGHWELCLTINDSWGYRHGDNNHKSVNQLVRYFCETIGKGGNLLLDIGPQADGTITPEQETRLDGLGTWIARHSPAINSTVRGLPDGHFYGPSTLSADRKTLYLICLDHPNHYVTVRGLRNTIRKASVVGTGTELTFGMVGGFSSHAVPGVLHIQAPAAADLDEHATVIALELDGELDLYQGQGQG